MDNKKIPCSEKTDNTGRHCPPAGNHAKIFTIPHYAKPPPKQKDEVLKHKVVFKGTRNCEK